MNREITLRRIKTSLDNYCPKGTSGLIASWVVDLKVDFKITPKRKTKLGDFRPPQNNKPARITVNGDLNEYNFLVTTIHEFAHLGCFLKYGSKVPPHGKEWKSIYTELLGSFLKKDLFPLELEKAIRIHLAKPSASSCSCMTLSRALAKYDNNASVFLEELPLNTKFYFNRRAFVNLHKRRTRYMCLEPLSGKKYLISGRAQVLLEREN